VIEILAAAVFACSPVEIVDGDGLRCAGIAVRLAAIDAPDHPNSRKCRGASKWPRWCDADRARASKAALAALVRGRAVSCVVVDASPFRDGFQRTDRYGRPVVRCSVGGRDLSAAQLTSGNARAWP